MEAKLTELVSRLRAAAGENLTSVVLYGSAVTGEYVSGRSNLNVLCLVRHAVAEQLEELHPAVEWWSRQRQPPPLVFTLDELHHSADVFAIELLDIKQQHRILFGEDFLAEFVVPLQLHRLQVERELRTDWLRFRQALLVAPYKNKIRVSLMLDSVSSFCSLFRHGLFALGQGMPANKRDSIIAVASVTGADPSAFQQILDLREGKRAIRDLDVEVVLHNYLVFVEVFADEIDRRFAAS
ncbi:MAG: hypothetical protein WBE88_11515 [Candidatus Acidiferrales bacterium]